MAEPKNATSSAVGSKSKEKGLLLDEDFGKDFLGSWKSMSVTEDDAMDFSFGTISKGKKKAFNFDKLDMDFNVDGDFDKLPSFKMDMPDLDFSSPSKGTAKDKENSKEETTSGKRQEKKDRFSFSFDFNELDGFDFDSSLTKGEKTCKKSEESKAIALEISEISNIDQALQGEKTSKKSQDSMAGALESSEILNIDQAFQEEKTCKNSQDSKALEGSEIFDIDQAFQGEKTCKESQDSKAVALESCAVSNFEQALDDDCIAAKLNGANPKAETSKGGMDPCNSIDDSISVKLVPLQGLAHGDPVAGQGSGIPPQKIVDTLVEERCKSRPLSNSTVSSELDDQQLLQSSPMDFLSGNISNQETVFDMQAEVCTQGTRTNTSSDAEQNVDDRIITTEGSIHQKYTSSTLSNMAVTSELPDQQQSLQSSPLDSLSGNNTNQETVSNIQTEVCSQGIHTSSEAEQNINDKVITTEGSKMHWKNSSPPSESDKDDNNMASGNVLAEIHETQSVQGDIVLKDISTASSSEEIPENTGAKNDIQNPTHKLPLVSSNRCSDPTVSQTEKRDRESGSIRSRFFRRSEETISHLAKPSQSEKEVSTFSNKEIGAMHSCPTITNEKRDDSDGGQAQNGRKLVGLSKLSSQNLTKGRLVLQQTEKNAVSSSDISLRANPPNCTEKTIESSIQTSVNPKPQVPKLASLQTLNVVSEAPKSPKEAPAVSRFKSTRTIVPNREQLNCQRETIPLRNLEQNKDSPMNTSKIAPPVGNAENQAPKLPSLKRKAVQVQNQKNSMEVSPKAIQSDHLISRSEVLMEVNMTELGSPSVMENDENVEKAEAYGKELDEIFNMLKKKHEEAKELLVQALVNNNNLLMLNHSMVKEKISFPFLYMLS
ncbi:hypothetical protein CCACVL1_15775 [Corchorus capsularis]|uniref:Uncharacterized protein n=1 Tax=Corchorus capsularis TaxID=210143 RepID=A0A1R3I154_COCAP|nr:hypothetical protein CCACVL1_15775 [Corchorus capsularis]